MFCIPKRMVIREPYSSIHRATVRNGSRGGRKCPRSLQVGGEGGRGRRLSDFRR
ncbi:hypothetical protein C8R48DRAFT_720519 [Suillus tomentosus]|nr:hypothetical protein C8R48DRAFT_720519 [Suillus tomentosus]